MEVNKGIISCVHELGWYRVPLLVTGKSNSHDIKNTWFLTCTSCHYMAAWITWDLWWISGFTWQEHDM